MTSAAIAMARLLLFESVARVRHRLGWQTPMRLGKPSAWGKASLRLGGPSGQGKALWKTANRIGWDPIFDAAKLRQMVLGTKRRIPYLKDSAFSAFVF